MAKRLLALVVCLVLVAALVGCGKKVTFNTEDWGDLKIRVAGYRQFNDDPLNFQFANGAAKFTEEYGTEVEFLTGGGNGMGDDLVAAIVSGDPWEIQYVFGCVIFPTALAEGLFTPVTDYIDFDTNDKIDKITMDGTIWKGDYYGVSTAAMQEFVHLTYNETWMKELGLTTPYELYEEDNWNMDTYKELLGQAKALGARTRAAIWRAHVATTYLAKWDDDGRVTMTYDSPENVEWLNWWADLIQSPNYGVTGAGRVSSREVIMRDEVMPNLIIDELTQETTDVIRYINFPTMDGRAAAYLNDSHFTFPAGVAEEKLPCAFLLSCYMADEKAKDLMATTYGENMQEQDMENIKKTMEGFYYLPRACWNANDAVGHQFRKDLTDGKSVATHIAENNEKYIAIADEFNAKYVD